jgi:protein-disulfide isomerase
VPADTTRRTKRERLAARRAAEAAARAQAERRRRTLIGGVVGAVVVLVVLVVVVVVQTHRTSTSAAAPAPANTVGGTEIVVGSATAPVTVDLYEDFQCPNCKAFEAATGSTLAQLVAAGTVQAHYHGMAFLDTSANDKYSTRALNAAGAVLAAGGPAAFQTFHDLLFANQPPETGSGLTDDRLVQYATQAGATGASVAHHRPGEQGRRPRHADRPGGGQEADRPDGGRAHGSRLRGRRLSSALVAVSADR